MPLFDNDLRIIVFRLPKLLRSVLSRLHRLSLRPKFYAAFVMAAVVALVNYSAWSVLGVTPAAPDVPAKVNGVTYAPFGRDDAPWVRQTPIAELIDADLQALSTITDQIRIYSAAQFPELPTIAAKHGMKVSLGAWLNKYSDNNEKEISAALQTAEQHSNIKQLIIGNETLLKKSLTPEQLVGYLKRVRQASKLPVSTAEPWHIWLKYPELATEVDFITIHLLPYWEGVGLDTAVDESLQRLAWVRARHPNKQIVIGEVGYPSNGDSIKRALPSPAAQAAFVRQFVARSTKERLDYFLIEAFDQPWKQSEEGLAGAYWGLFDAARSPKFGFSGTIEPDPYWRSKALASSLAGFMFLSFFLSRLRNLRATARLTFAAATQGVLSLATVVVTLPLWHYMSTGDWLMLAVLIPTCIVMVAILLAHLFEFVELFWEGSLKRRFLPRPLAQDAHQPFVSIHLACCNEPPHMVIATLKSLRELDYQAFEVIVVDNNTADEALWKPVRDFVATLPPAFRFFHLPTWPGYKAGALNFALEQTDARAQIVGVVDADYVVKAEWLSSLVSYFSDAQVGIVQAPQAHRDWGDTVFRKMMNWEYEGFFRIGMHHRNERDAIIQHGTMTLIRADALRQHGCWSEWCLCEDAELGLRLMQQNLRTVYVDAVMGEGLTPDDFSAFKKQRRRWAQGGMQIFKSHWRSLLGLDAASSNGSTINAPASHRLSLGQRYHFLAGWLPWVGDALHLIFVGGALLRTIGLIAWPQYFSPPVVLFMLPLAMFCLVKLVIGPLLYWRRVPCSIGNILGASVAGMGLSHAIARGLLSGLSSQAGVFQITKKGRLSSVEQAVGRRISGWFATVREESMLLIALILAILATALTRENDQIETLVWMAMLALQALPYLAALACSVVAAMPQVRTTTQGPLRQLRSRSPRLDNESSGSR